MEKLRAAIAPHPGSDAIVSSFYTRWFASDISVRELFAPDMRDQRTAFALALSWVFGELAAQRAEEPVAFLAQLGRDHRKYGVLPSHYDGMREALFSTLRSHLVDEWDDALADAAQQAIDFIAGVMRGAAEAETMPPFTDGTVVEHIGPPATCPSSDCNSTSPSPTTPASTSRSKFLNGRVVGATSARRCPATPKEPSSFTSDRSPAAW